MVQFTSLQNFTSIYQLKLHDLVCIYECLLHLDGVIVTWLTQQRCKLNLYVNHTSLLFRVSVNRKMDYR